MIALKILQNRLELPLNQSINLVPVFVTLRYVCFERKGPTPCTEFNSVKKNFRANNTD